MRTRVLFAVAVGLAGSLTSAAAQSDSELCLKGADGEAATACGRLLKSSVTDICVEAINARYPSAATSFGSETRNDGTDAAEVERAFRRRETSGDG